MSDIRSLTLGDAVVHALTDCAPLPAEWRYAFPESDPASRPELAARWFPDSRFHTRFGCFLLQRGGDNVLVDCGLGPGPVAYFPGLAGSLPAVLRQLGLATGDIGAVVFTHLHVDHVGWAVDAQGGRVFRNARHVVAALEWRHWRDQGAQAGRAHHVEAVRRAIAPIAEAGDLHLLDAGEKIVPGMSLMATPGHTPGHHSLVFEQGDSKLLLAGDLWHSPAQVAAPLWCHRADMDKTMAVATRRRVADWALRNGVLLGAGHFPGPCAFGRITPAGFVPLP